MWMHELFLCFILHSNESIVLSVEYGNNQWYIALFLLVNATTFRAGDCVVENPHTTVTRL